MFLIDSSVWIEYLRPKGPDTVKDRVRALIQGEEVCSCGVVVVEVLRGAKSEKDFRTLRDSLMSLPQLALDEEVVGRAAQWGHALDRRGKTVSTTDLLIASASYGKASLLHRDSDFDTISAAFNIRAERI